MAVTPIMKIYYGGIVLLWLVLMSVLVYRHYGPDSRNSAPRADLTEGIADSTAVPFNLSLPENTSYLRVRISGIDLSRFDLSGGRQRLEGETLMIFRDQPVEETEGSVPSDYLEESFSIKSKDPATAALAREIVKDEKDAVRAARLIHDWVFVNIEKVRTVSVPVSTEVLKVRKGDCNEHAALFTALARAAGIPSRMALGLVYGDGSLHYHSWSEIFAGRWIAADPTLGQFPADATHIRLITGDLDEQAMILSVIGKIRVEGLEYRPEYRPEYR